MMMDWETRPARPREGRQIAGVSAAIARRYDIDPVLVRVGFVVAAFYGIGAALYIAGWVLLPDEPGPAINSGRRRPKALLLIGKYEWDSINVDKPAAGVNAAPFEGWKKGDNKVEPLVNDKDSVKFIADVAETIVGKENMNREGPFVMASEDFSYMLEKVPGAFINIGNGGGEGGCEVHNPGYDFNDEIITLGATLWSRVVETKLAKDAR